MSIIQDVFIKSAFLCVVPADSDVETLKNRIRAYTYKKSQHLHLTIFYIGSLEKAKYEQILDAIKKSNLKVGFRSTATFNIGRFIKSDSYIFYLKPDETAYEAYNKSNHFYRKIFKEFNIFDENKKYNAHLTLFSSDKNIPSSFYQSLKQEFKNTKMNINNERIYLMGKTANTNFTIIETLSEINLSL